ncbi:MFS transporter [Arthrobacter sp. NamB2]|uniref:MFS transporter n=1 Tax=Arthrobacter sp. NamB2 TaxID=2576035 RepID=UPI0010C9F18A|nr:MFS transporter [Arthrobacter sp. NamB2]TKV29154.1 MFS transporter [Arthrobacter sp. NamB2]
MNDQSPPTTINRSSVLPTPSSTEIPQKQVLQALAGLFTGLFTGVLSSTIVTNALPTIMTDLQGSQTVFAWVVTVALLAGAVTTPIWGRLADLLDKKLLVQLSILVFIVGSVVAGLAPDIPTLLTGRVLQGIAMGGITALAMAIVGALVSPRERGKYNGYLGGVIAAATAAGPVIGGIIVDSPLGWRWTFLVTVPFAAAALVLLHLTLKLGHQPRRISIDWLGSILLASSVGLLLIWVSFAGRAGFYDWVSWQSLLMIAGSILLGVLLTLAEARAAEPVLPLGIITDRTTALAIVASIAVGVALFAATTYLGQYYQVARGASATEAGLLMLPLILGNLLGAVVSGQLISRSGRWKRFLIAGSVLLVLGFGLAGSVDHRTDLALVGLYLFLLGGGLGLLMQNLVLAVQNTVPLRDVGAASAAVSTFRTIGGAAGVAVLGSVLAHKVASDTAAGLRHAGLPANTLLATEGTPEVESLPAAAVDIVRSAYGTGTGTIFLIVAFTALLAFASVVFIEETALRRTVDVPREEPRRAPQPSSPDRNNETTGALTPDTAGQQLQPLTHAAFPRP